MGVRAPLTIAISFGFNMYRDPSERVKELYSLSGAIEDACKAPHAFNRIAQPAKHSHRGQICTPRPLAYKKDRRYQIPSRPCPSDLLATSPGRSHTSKGLRCSLFLSSLIPHRAQTSGGPCPTSCAPI